MSPLDTIFKAETLCWPSTTLRIRRWTPSPRLFSRVGRNQDARPQSARGGRRRAGGRHHPTDGVGRSAAMAVRIVWSRPHGTMISAIWNVIDRPYRTILAPLHQPFAQRGHRPLLGPHRAAPEYRGNWQDYFRHYATRLAPRAGLIAEARVVAANLERRSIHRVIPQPCDVLLQHRVGRQPDRVFVALGFGLAKAASPRKQRRLIPCR
jgi:hypothetical protein